MAKRTHPLGLLLCLAALAAAPTARAQTATVTAYTGQSCAGTRAGSSLGCTSNDFTTSATFTQPAPGLPSCVAGSVLTLDVIAQITSHSPTRYDGAIFTGEQGNDPSVQDATQTCSVGVFPAAPAPFMGVDADGCGDFASSASASLAIRSIRVVCQPAPGTNVLGIPYVLVFDNQLPKTPSCSYANVTAGTSSKCVANTSAQVTGVVVQGWLKLTEQTNPAGQSQAFSFGASGTAAPSPASFTLAPGATQTVQVPLPLPLADGTPGTQTLQLDQAAVPGWAPGATITCTSPSGGAAPYVTVDGANRRITATLDVTHYGASCTITNEKLATVTVVERTMGGAGAFAFGGGTNGLPTSLALDTSGGNPASSARFPVLTDGAAASLTQTVPAGWWLSSASCSDGTSTSGALAGSTLTIPAASVAPGKDLVCTFVDTRAATLSKAFAPPLVPAGGASTLTFTLANAPGSPAQAGLGFTDAFPAGLKVASPLAVSNGCGGALYRSGTATPLAAGDPGLALSGGALAAGQASCTVAVGVTAASAGSYLNGPAQVSGLSPSLLSGVADQTLGVYDVPNLLMVKSADRSTVKPGEDVTYTLVVQNAGAGAATGVVLGDPVNPLVWWSLDAFGTGAPFRFVDGSPSSGLALGTPRYSSDGGTTWTLVPTSGGGGAPDGYEGRVTNWMLPLTGTMAPGGRFTLSFTVRVR